MKSNSFTASHGIPGILRNSNSVYKSPSPVAGLSQIKQVYTPNLFLEDPF